MPSAQDKALGRYPVRLSSTNESNPPGKAKTAVTQFGRQPVLGSNEQIFGADEQVPKGGCGRQIFGETEQNPGRHQSN